MISVVAKLQDCGYCQNYWQMFWNRHIYVSVRFFADIAGRRFMLRFGCFNKSVKFSLFSMGHFTILYVASSWHLKRYSTSGIAKIKLDAVIMILKICSFSARQEV